MATIALEYDVYNRPAKGMIEIARSLGLTTSKKSGLEKALEDVAKGRVMTIHTPKNQLTNLF